MSLNSWGDGDEEKKLQRLKAMIRMAFTVGSSKRLNQYIENFLQLNKNKSEESSYK